MEKFTIMNIGENDDAEMIKAHLIELQKEWKCGSIRVSSIDSDKDW